MTEPAYGPGDYAAHPDEPIQLAPASWLRDMPVRLMVCVDARRSAPEPAMPRLPRRCVARRRR